MAGTAWWTSRRCSSTSPRRASEKKFLDGMEDYRLSLPDDRRVLFDRYRLEDFAVKVVGIGSVGTRCLVGLFSSPEGHPLFLQVKEACPSVLAPYAGRSVYAEPGPAGGRRATADAVLQRHLPGLDAGGAGVPVLRAPAAGHEALHPGGGRFGRAIEAVRRILRDGARPRPRQVRRCGADRRLSRKVGRLRRGDRRVRAGVRGPDGSRPLGAGRGGEGRGASRRWWKRIFRREEGPAQAPMPGESGSQSQSPIDERGKT